MNAASCQYADKCSDSGWLPTTGRELFVFALIACALIAVGLWLHWIGSRR